MNVLVTSSSAKVLLVKEFAKWVAKLGGRVFTGDISAEVATAFFSDQHFILPKTSNKSEFKQYLKTICKQYDIKLVVPTRDGELALMAEMKNEFAQEGITILVPSERTIELCLNKRKFADILIDNGFSPVPILKDLHINPPYFVRPVFSAASAGAKMISSIEEAKLFMNDDFMVHPFIDADEFSIDLLMNLEGTKPLQAVCRRRTNIVGGESKISNVVDLPILEQTCMEIGKLLGLVAHNVLQAFYSEDLGVIMIEANARFGGASNLSIQAGLDSPRRILAMLYEDDSAYQNKEIKKACMYRYSEDVIYESGIS